MRSITPMTHTHSLLHVQSSHGPAPPRAGPRRG